MSPSAIRFCSSILATESVSPLTRATTPRSSTLSLPERSSFRAKAHSSRPGKRSNRGHSSVKISGNFSLSLSYHSVKQLKVCLSLSRHSGGLAMESLKNELKQVLRRLGRAPMFTAITLITLAAGVGANTVVFSVLEGVLLKPLPYPKPDE